MGGRGYGGGGRGRVYTSRYTVTTRMTCIKMGSDESHFNVSLIVKDKVTRQCPRTTTFEEKGEPKRYRTEVLPLTSPPPYRQAKPALKLSSFTPALFLVQGKAVSVLQHSKRLQQHPHGHNRSDPSRPPAVKARAGDCLQAVHTEATLSRLVSFRLVLGRQVVLLNVLRCQLTYKGQAETNAEARFNIALRPRKPEGSLGRTAQDGHFDSHTAPEL